jgi:NAD(P)H dehydrogenase (quinone)
MQPDGGHDMYSITGITGQVGSAVARALLGSGQTIRAVARDPAKVSAWTRRGCEIAVADMADSAALARAFEGTDGVFVLLPPVFDPSPGFTEARAYVDAVKAAIIAASPARVVCLSTIGAQAVQPNLLNQLGIMEQQLADLDRPVAFVRPAWFMENAACDVAPARENGVIPSFLQPLDKAFPMVATADIGSLAARALQETWQGRRVIELEGPCRVTPNDIATAFSAVLQRPVHMQVVARDAWEALFRAQGMKNPLPRMQMLDGFNEGWIEFEGGAGAARKGTTTLQSVLRELAERG